MPKQEEKEVVMIPLTEEQIEAIVERVTERLETKVYVAVGRTVFEKFFWFIGVGVAAVGAFVYHKTGFNPFKE